MPSDGSAAGAYDAQDSVLPLKRCVVRRPTKAFSDADPVAWHYVSKPDLAEAQREHDALVAAIREEVPDCEIIYHDADDEGKLADSIYVHDPVIVTRRGAILLEMGKALRKGEPSLIEKTMVKNGIPILARLADGWDGQGEAPTAEGGDMLFVDHKTLCIGMGFRTNLSAVKSLRTIFEKNGLDIEVLAWDLP